MGRGNDLPGWERFPLRNGSCEGVVVAIGARLIGLINRPGQCHLIGQCVPQAESERHCARVRYDISESSPAPFAVTGPNPIGEFEFIEGIGADLRVVPTGIFI